MGYTPAMNKLAAGLLLAASALTAQAVTVNDVSWDPDSPLDFSAFSLAIRQTIDPTTGVVSGFGVISTMNGTSAATFCPGCEVTFTFGDFRPVTSNPIPSTTNATVNYTGGYVNVYQDSTPEITNAADPTTLNLANTSDGTLWLSLKGHAVNDVTLVGTVATNGLTGSNARVTGLTGLGLLDVVGGAAAAHFDTNTRADGADLSFSNSFTLFLPANNIFDAAGTGNFAGNTLAVPEPASVLMFGAGLLGLAAVARRRHTR